MNYLNLRDYFEGEISEILYTIYIVFIYCFVSLCLFDGCGRNTFSKCYSIIYQEILISIFIHKYVYKYAFENCIFELDTIKSRNINMQKNVSWVKKSL